MKIANDENKKGQKNSIIDVQQGSEYASDFLLKHFCRNELASEIYGQMSEQIKTRNQRN